MAFDLITAADRRHSTLQKGFNLRWPLGNVQGESSSNGANLIYLCYSPQDIIDAAAQALAIPDGRITVRSGGHCYEGFVANKMPDSPNEVLSIIDISQLNQVVYDATGQIASQLVPASPHRYSYRLEAGGQNWDAYVALYKLANTSLPGGSCYSVGLGGHICGGGYGLLSRKDGLVCDWLSGVDILVPNAQGNGLVPVHVARNSTQQDELDLFAACCGAGGGQFGIITSYYFERLPQAPKEVLWLVLEWDWSLLTKPALDRLLAAYQGWFARNQANPDTWGLATKLEMRHQNTGNVTMDVHYVDKQGELNDQAPFEDFVSSMLNAIGIPATECLSPSPTTHLPHSNPPGPTINSLASALAATRRMDWLHCQQTLNGSGPNQRGRYKSAYQKGIFIATVLQAIWDTLTWDDPDKRLTQSLIQIQSFGGQINQASAAVRRESSVAQRSSYLKWQPQCYWRDESSTSDQAHAQWIQGLFFAAFANDNGVPVNAQFEGCYINYPDRDMLFIDGDPSKGPNPQWYKIFFPDLMIESRLRRTKQRWDPLNVFRNEMSVP
ncbi:MULTISPECIES: BBE domain-containing protein [unclassified Pseudomonas]|uniref:BBE domain-containing protein n=1 Tax=unclassified Pseudomonas TaxID=196821 RepID=UPI000C86DB69|nr:MULTISPECIES: BBE domain-containing protein [unclassified Pseudomonas]PMV23815.1 FAD-binding oxidoreductase [Pseudomonas sp. FW305-3-2-15-C-TSA2]PMV30482.1 FAD-binding oxidoreductase [Pseudomonas sp. DP16D-L5]PMV40688.1 FAD-binding oxidoreductase [Pseudomonas sp. FW305-3-2-15-A-LB2]PMV47548.1 FAD-binding oxidoreductase [Pseudomonas sp. FW305-3-2-15-C-R2A1]PMV52968.1 FAD-binding oxidoreductase [Pseudomonas sp. FW305-3-2-15-C-LB1]